MARFDPFAEAGLAHFFVFLRAAGLFAVIALAGLPAAALADDTHLTLHTAKGDFRFTVEVADTDAQRERGLMFRKTLAPDAGMIFDFHATVEVGFWMKDTLIPLDMVFIAADGRVEGVHANAKPMDTTLIASPMPVRFVLEIAGGRAAEIGLEPGDSMDYSRVTRSQ
jgi:uncharacterized membrane protein (UPF0127 family)